MRNFALVYSDFQFIRDTDSTLAAVDLIKNDDTFLKIVELIRPTAPKLEMGELIKNDDKILEIIEFIKTSDQILELFDSLHEIDRKYKTIIGWWNRNHTRSLTNADLGYHQEQVIDLLNKTYHKSPVSIFASVEGVLVSELLELVCSPTLEDCEVYWNDPTAHQSIADDIVLKLLNLINLYVWLFTQLDERKNLIAEQLMDVNQGEAA